VIQGHEVSPVMDKGVPDAECGCADVTRAVHPARVFLRGRGSTDVHVDVGAVCMLDHAPVEKVGALVRSYLGLGVYSKMEAIEAVNILAQAVHH